MRLTYILLMATATTLLASGNALFAATNADQTAHISTMGSPNLATLLEVGTGAGNEKRFLRRHRVEENDDDSNEEEEDDDEEERRGGANLFQSSKLDKMLSGINEFKRYTKLKAHGYTPGSLQTKLESMYGNKYKDLWQRYSANYYTI